MDGPHFQLQLRNGDDTLVSVTYSARPDAEPEVRVYNATEDLAERVVFAALAAHESWHKDVRTDQ